MKRFFSFFLFILCFQEFLAGKSEPFYEDSFDLGAGGTNLTRASQEGILLSNPALLPYGGTFFRWLGWHSNFVVSKETLELAQGKTENIVDKVFDKPVHLGISQSISFLTNNGGLAAFASIEPDLKAFRRGDSIRGSGLPQIRFKQEVYGGFYGSLAKRIFSDWFALGLNIKYLAIQEKDLYIDLLDPQAFGNLAQELSPDQLKKNLNRGIGSDLGGLFFWQNPIWDLRMGFMVQDIANTKLSGKTLDQKIHLGLGSTWHTDEDAIHLSLEWRDVADKGKDPLFKRIHLGARFLFQTWVGLAVGVYHGFPTYGLEADLLLFRLSGAFYTKEYSPIPNRDRRQIYVLSIATGFDF
jgi:hypothetical protein